MNFDIKFPYLTREVDHVDSNIFLKLKRKAFDGQSIRGCRPWLTQNGVSWMEFLWPGL
jgi:hypothetical protein